MYDLIVIGGGPAGLTAAIYGLQKRLNVLLVSKDLGGKTNYRLGLPWIEDYQVIRGLEIVNKFRSELEYLDFARHMEGVEQVTLHEDPNGAHFVVHTKGGGGLQTRAVILATGVRQQRLNVPGEREFIMRGLCYSALNYAPLFIDKQTAVVGDGDLALRSAAELATVAGHVTLIRSVKEISDTPLYKKLATSTNVSILNGFQVVEIKGDQYARSLIVKGLEGSEQEIVIDGTFIEMALIPNTQMVKGLVEMDDQGRIKVDNNKSTSVPGLFAAGDATLSHPEQVLIAIGEGAKAALSAYEYLLPIL